MSMAPILKILLSLKGRSIQNYAFEQETVIIGRDPKAHIFLDNPGVSRQHAKIDRVQDQYYVEDLGSANGTYVNDTAVKRQPLKHNDLLRVGKFSLQVSLESTQRARSAHGLDDALPDSLEHTTVLTSDQLARVLATAKAGAQERPALKVVEKTDPAPTRDRASERPFPILAVAVALVVGIIIGAGAVLVAQWVLSMAM
ncbi:MAG: FHA domain-containing protein [Candidatus Eisenbacteria sp.]|nr:FHA domain-containing protein [Candidatus Eisenbacteria bacterium]